MSKIEQLQKQILSNYFVGTTSIFKVIAIVVSILLLIFSINHSYQNYLSSSISNVTVIKYLSDIIRSTIFYIVSIFLIVNISFFIRFFESLFEGNLLKMKPIVTKEHIDKMDKHLSFLGDIDISEVTKYIPIIEDKSQKIQMLTFTLERGFISSFIFSMLFFCISPNQLTHSLLNYISTLVITGSLAMNIVNICITFIAILSIFISVLIYYYKVKVDTFSEVILALKIFLIESSASDSIS